MYQRNMSNISSRNRKRTSHRLAHRVDECTRSEHSETHSDERTTPLGAAVSRYISLSAQTKRDLLHSIITLHPQNLDLDPSLLPHLYLPRTVGQGKSYCLLN